MSRSIIIGGGVSGLVAAAHLARAGHKTTLLEKNHVLGGRARYFESDGFRFDMGPSWYWMPEIFEEHYREFGHTTSDFYKLKRLDPSYRVVWQDESYWDLPADWRSLCELLETVDPGITPRIDRYMRQAKYRYDVGMREMVRKPSLRWTEYLDPRLGWHALRMRMLRPITKEIAQVTTDPKIRELMAFPVLFLGAKPRNTPALYSMMGYADMQLGSWYPAGGMYGMIEAMQQIAEEHGAELITRAEVIRFQGNGNRIDQCITDRGSYSSDQLLMTGDYAHLEKNLLSTEQRQYDDSYWDTRVMAPSCLLFYLGVNKRLDLPHHTLFFDAPFTEHAEHIYDTHSVAPRPLFYACHASATDETVAPEGMSNLFLLIPLSTELDLSTDQVESYYEQLMTRLESHLGDPVADHVIYRRDYARQDFIRDYHAHKGNAYGLANTLRQTAFLKPRMRSRKVKNLYFAGQLTVPGPGVPPSIISGEIAARLIIKQA